LLLFIFYWINYSEAFAESELSDSVLAFVLQPQEQEWQLPPQELCFDFDEQDALSGHPMQRFPLFFALIM